MTLCELNIINGKPVFVQEKQIEYSHKWDKPTLTYKILRGTEDIKLKTNFEEQLDWHFLHGEQKFP